MIKLAQLLAPQRAVLELYVTKPPVESVRVGPCYNPLYGPHRNHQWWDDAWSSAVVLDSVNRVVYTLDPRYWEDSEDGSRLPPPCELLKGKVRVRAWRKDGGVPFLLFAWLRFRRSWPLELVRALQACAVGTDRMRVPAWLSYADATAHNWQGARIHERTRYNAPAKDKAELERKAYNEAELERMDALEQRAADSLVESYETESFW